MKSATVAVLLTALALGACGGGNTGTGRAGEPTASAPEATQPPTDATQPGTTAVTPPTTTTQPLQTQTGPGGGSGGGGSDESGGAEAVRVPAVFTVVAGGLRPRVITVPPFLAVEITLMAGDGRPHTLVLQTTPPHTLHAAAGGRDAMRIHGLRAGRYAVTLDGRRAGALVAGGEVGP